MLKTQTALSVLSRKINEQKGWFPVDIERFVRGRRVDGRPHNAKPPGTVRHYREFTQ